MNRRNFIKLTGGSLLFAIAPAISSALTPEDIFENRIKNGELIFCEKFSFNRAIIFPENIYFEIDLCEFNCSGDYGFLASNRVIGVMSNCCINFNPKANTQG